MDIAASEFEPGRPPRLLRQFYCAKATLPQLFLNHEPFRMPRAGRKVQFRNAAVE